MKRVLKILLILLIVVYGIGATAYLFMLKKDHEQARADWEAAVQRQERKYDLIHRKYTDAKALSQELTKIRYTLESRNQSQNQEIDKLKAVQADYEARIAELNRKIEAGSENCKDRVAGVRREIEQLKSEKEAVQKALKVQAAEKTEVEANLQALKQEKRSVESQLERTQRQFKRCETDNAELAEIAEDLLYEYENKGVMDALMAKEPVTQIKKVEVEKKIQEYKEKIEKEAMQ